MTLTPSGIGDAPAVIDDLETAFHHGLSLPRGVLLEDLRHQWVDEGARTEFMNRYPAFREQYETIMQRVLVFSRKIADVLRRAAEDPQAFGVDVPWRETQVQMLRATAQALERGYRHLAFEIPTGVGKSMLLGAYLRAFFEACREDGSLGDVEAILFTSRANLVLQLAGESFREQAGDGDEDPILSDEQVDENNGDEGDDQAVNWGDVKKWVAPVVREQGIRLVTGETDVAEREKDAALTVMTYQGFTTIPQDSLKRTRNIGALVFDEAHRISQRVREDIETQFPGALRLGGSATMKGPPSSKPFQVFQRIDAGKENFRSHLAYYASLGDAIEREELKAVRCLQKGVAIDLSDVSRTSTGNLNQKELSRKMMYNIPVLAQFIRETFEDRHPVLELAGAKPVSERTIVASVKRIAIAIELSKFCNEQLDVPANWTSGFDNPKVFRRKIQALARRDIQILFSAGKLGEGLDVEEVDAVMSLWPYNLTSMWVLKQLIGRGMRLHEGDRDCLVVEPIFEAGLHKIATTPELFKIEETYPGVLVAPAAPRQVEMKIVKALNDGGRPLDVWNGVLSEEERAVASRFGWEAMLKQHAEETIPEIPVVRNERYIKDILRRRRKQEKNEMSHEELVKEAVRQLQRKGITIETLADYPSAVFAQMRFGPFSRGTALYNEVMGTNAQILVQEHVRQLAEYLLSQEVVPVKMKKREKIDFQFLEAVDAIRGMMTVDLMQKAERMMQIQFQEVSWRFADSDEGIIGLMQDLWRAHDRLKSIMLDAVDPMLFKAASQSFKAAKMCVQFNFNYINRGVLRKGIS